MTRRTPFLPATALLLVVTLAEAMEWRSADGKNTFEAEFVGMQGEKVLLRSDGKQSAHPLTAFSADHQKFAKNAQLIADAAAKWGPQSFEIGQVVDGGWVCRLALPPSSRTAPVIFTGELFVVVAADPSQGKQGDQFKDMLLFGAGGRTYHPLKGEPSPVRAFALSAEEATKVWTETVAQSKGDPARQSPPVMEPDIEITTTRGVGIAIGKGGLFLVDPELAKNATSLVVRHASGNHPATLVETNDALGVSVVSCKLPIQPARIGSRKPAALGQNVFAVSVSLNTTKKALASRPTVTRGIVSRPTDTRSGAFEHDATVPPESPGGFVVGEKGDVLGIYFKPQASGRASTAKKGPIEGLANCISTSSLSAFLEKVPGASSLKVSSGGGDMEKLTAELMDSTVLMVSTHEVRKPRAVPTAKAGPATGAGGPVTGWSLSKSGTRHSSKCRYYDAKSSCAATDGKPCKICGG